MERLKRQWPWPVESYGRVFDVLPDRWELAGIGEETEFYPIPSSVKDEQRRPRWTPSTVEQAAPYLRGDDFKACQLRIADKVAKWIEGQAGRGRAIVFIGLAHLFGPVGLKSLLEARGINVCAVSAVCPAWELGLRSRSEWPAIRNCWIEVAPAVFRAPYVDEAQWCRDLSQE
jgi:hypothetical protein